MKTLSEKNIRSIAFCLMGILSLTMLRCGSGKQTGIEQEESSAGNGLVELTAEQIKANDLELGQPQEVLFSRFVSASGYLEALPRNIHTVSLVFGGIIRDLNLLTGDRVLKGQFLFRIWNQDLLQIQEEYLAASALLKFQQDDYERQKILVSENVSAQKVFLKAESDYYGTKARVQALEARLSLLQIDKQQLLSGKMVSSVTVTSPINGFITRVEGSNGKFVTQDSYILEIMETSPLLLSLQVFEKDITVVREGQVVKFGVPEVTTQTFEARIIKTGKTLDKNRTVNVHAFFTPDTGLRLLPGMFVKAEIVTETFAAMALPLGAVIAGDAHSFVLVKTNPEPESWKLEKVAVVTGYRDQGMVEIMPVSKLAFRDKVVVSGAFSVANK